MAMPLTTEPGTQPYTFLLYRAIRELGVRVEPYRTGRAVLHPPDVIHWHWPEHVLARRGLRRITRVLVVLGSLSVARKRGAVLVYTAHNVWPHDRDLDRFGQWFLRSFDRMADLVLVLTEAGWAEVAASRPCLRPALVRHTRHGHFRDVYPDPPSAEVARRRFGIAPQRTTLAFVGLVRPYKGVLELLAAVEGAKIEIDVLIAGACPDGELREELEWRARADPRLHLRLEILSPEDVAAAIGAATLVAAPFRRVLNSGSVMLALSLGRRVLVPATPTFKELREEVGATWVHLYEAQDVGADDVIRAMAEPPLAAAPEMPHHGWHRIAEATVKAYREALGIKSSPGRA